MPGHIVNRKHITEFFCFATELMLSVVEYPSKSRQLRNSKHDQFLSGLSIQVTTVCYNKVTMKFAGLPLTCVEAVVYGCRC